MITHDDARFFIKLAFEELTILLEYHKLSTNLTEKWGKELIDYISQQEKVTELLGLYRHVYFHDKMMSEEEFYQTLYKIKALEEEMK